MYRPSYDPDAFISVEDLYRPHISTIVPDAPDDEENLSGPEDLAHSDSSDADLNTGDSEPEIGYDSDEVEEPYNVDYEEGPSDWEGDAIDTSDSDGSDCASDGYASY